ncbi:hypothetical protein SDC9_151000 [bioreactor metagenome]|uniref:Uncharacterized protein n=1 Tax=bioreactor metagenome TaxID=1076179 RepID=A0A645EQP8_9ZZZZ
MPFNVAGNLDEPSSETLLQLIDIKDKEACQSIGYAFRDGDIGPDIDRILPPGSHFRAAIEMKSIRLLSKNHWDSLRSFPAWRKRGVV